MLCDCRFKVCIWTGVVSEGFLSSSLLWDVRQRWLLVSYGCFGTVCRSHLQGSSNPSRVPVCETSVTANLRWITYQKNEDLIYTAAEAWDHDLLFTYCDFVLHSDDWYLDVCLILFAYRWYSVDTQSNSDVTRISAFTNSLNMAFGCQTVRSQACFSHEWDRRWPSRLLPISYLIYFGSASYVL